MQQFVTPVFRFLFLFWLLHPLAAKGYSVLTHQALIDAAWDKQLKPLLQRKFPGSTEAQLNEAHAFAYGGAIAPDMGYYPLGSRLFTNLTHYVRSGDYVMALLNEAKTVNAYAFALGSLCHYYADTYGHPLGTNPAVPLIYPKLQEAYGASVTYAQDHISHMRTEFGFDVLQTARGNYASKQYHDFIGFRVDTAVMEKAFFSTYGLHIRDVFSNFPRALGMFRWSVAHFFPALTHTAWAAKKSDIKKQNPTATARNFRYRMQRFNQYKETGKEEERPALGTTLVSFLIRILPKVGPLRPLKFRIPGPEAEKLFIKSFDSVYFHYSQALQKLQHTSLQLANGDFDTGEKTKRGVYPLADQAYDELLLQLSQRGFHTVDPAVVQQLTQFYSAPGHPAKSKRQQRKERDVSRAVEGLRAVRN